MTNPFQKIEEARKYKQLDVGHHVKNYVIIPTVLDILGDLKGKRILDVGCGYGFGDFQNSNSFRFAFL